MSDYRWLRFLAIRWFNTGRSSGPSIGPAILGIAVGVAAMIIIIGVMNGFQMGFIDAVLELDSYHIRLNNGEKELPESMRSAVSPWIRSILPFIDIRTMAMNEKGRAEAVRIKVVPDDAFQLDPKLSELLVLRTGSFGDGLLIGSELARRMNIELDDSISILNVHIDPVDGLSANMLQIKISGIYHSGFYDFDAGLAFLPESYAEGIIKGEQWQIGIKLTDPNTDYHVIKATRASINQPYVIESWRSYNRAFFGALRMEKSIMMLLVGLIFLVVGVNIFHALKKAIYARLEDIATLKAMGASSGSLRQIFLINGGVAGLSGASIGLIVGLVITLNINQVFLALEEFIAFLARIVNNNFSFSFFSPDFFYIADVPVRLPFLEIFFIFISGIASALVASWVASKRISGLKPAEVLRDE
jgi:lipoprotein-releasing system permease protein